ncbi:hypothetical protein [Aquabacterium sp.]|uniref:hypothetical protein n=1 Tax=Aquabacterium sp. TaxID=1872578 RepID=UPI002BAAE179|nr:hypothetical protein [Aquabacterium sp.]HSW03030.1 hypothetical protein [Aquabacterium sp.]
MQPKVETRLQRALDANVGPDELIDVVLKFETDVQPAAGTMPIMQRRELRAQAMSKAIAHALARAGEITGTQPARVTPFPLTGSAFVQAPRQYLRALIEQGEVAGATLNSTKP